MSHGIRSMLLFIQIISPFLIGSINSMENLPGDINFKPSAPSMLKKGSRLSENEKAELLTNNERKKCRNTQNISLDVIYFLRYLQGKLTSVIPCREVGKSLEERLRGVSLLKKLQNILLEYFKFLKN